MPSRSRSDLGRRNDLDWKPLPDRTRTARPTSNDQSFVRKPNIEPYQYTKLEHTRSVRLLEVRLSRDPFLRFTKQIKCRIRHHDLIDKPLYTAVSYTWGSQREVTGLDVEGKVLKVRRNVEDMLRGLARLDQWRTLWVDAICIDQGNLQEKNTQVRLMGTIFAEANYVVSWLHGYPVDTSSLFMVSKIARHELESYPLAKIQEMIRDFFQHPYWERRWVIQEVALARRVFINAPGQDGQPDFQGFTKLEQAEVNKVLQSPVRQFLKSRLRQRTGDESLRTLLVTYKDSQCSDLRDKIFALVSLSSTAKVHLEVDYSAEPVALLFAVLRFAFAHEALSCGGIVGLLFQLKRQLRVSRTDLLQAYGMHQYGDVIPRLAFIAAYNRGYVSNDSVHPSWEACAYKCRHFVYTLRGLRTPLLRKHELSDQDNAMKFEERTQGLLNETLVSGQDLCVFTFTQKTSVDPTKMHSRTGLASSWVGPGDEIWQFADTPVAMVARREGEAYRIVARALLIKSAWEVECLTELEARYDWSRFLGQGKFLQESQPGTYEEKLLRVTCGILLDILEWVDVERRNGLTVS